MSRMTWRAFKQRVPHRTTLLIPGARRRRQLGAIGLIVALAACLTILFGTLAHGGQARAPHIYGAGMARMQAAVNAAGWPQQVYNWCGVSTLAAIADYRGASVSQVGAAGYLNSSAATSVWGTPSFIYPGPGFTADIARDAGTDPRSLAAGLAGLTGGRYHALVDHWGAWDATIRLAADLEYSGQPITVFVDHGQHSVVVSQVYANGDPVRDPGSIFALEVWDPGYGSAFDAQIQNSQAAVVGIGAWLSWGVYWGEPYEENSGWDPDPAVGPYTYNPSQGEYQHLWIGNWVYIQPGGPAGVSADWSVDQQDLVIPGQHGELPPGYVLPTPTPIPGVRIARTAPTIIPPPATPIQRRANVSGPPDAAQPPSGSSIFLDQPPGATFCIGPYCLRAVNLWWLAMSGALLLLALALCTGAVVAQRRATRRVRRGAPTLIEDPPSVTVREVTDTSPLTLAEMAALETPALDEPGAPGSRETPGPDPLLTTVASGEATTSSPGG